MRNIINQNVILLWSRSSLQICLTYIIKVIISPKVLWMCYRNFLCVLCSVKDTILDTVISDRLKLYPINWRYFSTCLDKYLTVLLSTVFKVVWVVCLLPSFLPEVYSRSFVSNPDVSTWLTLSTGWSVYQHKKNGKIQWHGK